MKHGGRIRMVEEEHVAFTFSHKHVKKPHLHGEWVAQNICWMLAEDLKPPKRSRNPLHTWLEQKEKKEERERERKDQHSWERESHERRKEPNPWDGSWWGDLLRKRKLKAPERKAQQLDWGGRAERELQRPSYHLPGPQSLRRLGGGWAPRLRLHGERTRAGWVETD